MWVKKGHIYSCDFYGTGSAVTPFVDKISEYVWRIYYTARTKDTISLPHYIDVEAGNPQNILVVNDKPLFTPGYPGTFDDTGISMTSIVENKGIKYIYYCGWNRRATTPYALSIGVAVVYGDNYDKLYDGPILDRSPYDPICVSAPHVVYEWGAFRMYYISFTGWYEHEGRIEPDFLVKCAYSFDGIKWETIDKPCFKPKYEGESFARPWVIKDGDVYKMWYSVRGRSGYRTREGQHYVIGYAESNNGENFRREPIDIGTSETGWDSEMIEYASVFNDNGKQYMFYNGNSFGKTGFGYAVNE